jgi:Tfp pilus assembly protein PilF
MTLHLFSLVTGQTAVWALLLSAFLLAGCGESPGSLNQLALESLQKGDLASAERNLKKALTKDPANMTLLANLVEVFFREQKWDEAVSLLKKSQSLEAAANDRSIKIRLAEAYVMNGDSGLAFSTLSDLLAGDNQDEYLLFLHGFSSSSPQPAIDSLTKAIQLKPDRKESYLALARAQAWNGDTDAARKTLADLDAKAGSTSETLLYQVALHLRDNDTQMARKVLQEAPAQMQQDPILKLYTAYLDLADRRIQEALSALESLEEDPALGRKAKLGSALCHLMLDDPNAAIEICEEVLKDAPDEVLAMNLAGLGQLKRLQKFLAKNSFQKSLEIRPDQPAIKALVARLGNR